MTRARVLCQCDCGNRLVVVRAYLLRKPNPKSDCGSCGSPLPINSYTYQVEYHTWTQMIRRCHNSDHQSYKDYGGRGIIVCLQWRDPNTGFETFLKDVGPRPPGHTLDRTNPDGNYEPSNVKWATVQEQARNKRNSKYVRDPRDGVVRPAAEIAEGMNMRYQDFRKMMIDKGEW